jgi:hypothetical protein
MPILSVTLNSSAYLHLKIEWSSVNNELLIMCGNEDER